MIKAKRKKYSSQREHDRWVAKRYAARRGRDYDQWFKVRGKLHEADVERKNQIKTVADFLKQVLPTSSSSAPRDASHSDTQIEHGPPVKPEPPPRTIPSKRRRLAFKTTTPIPSTSRDVVHETPTPQLLSIKRDVDDDVSTDDQQIEPDMIDYGAMRVGALASPYVCP